MGTKTHTPGPTPDAQEEIAAMVESWDDDPIRLGDIAAAIREYEMAPVEFLGNPSVLQQMVARLQRKCAAMREEPSDLCRQLALTRGALAEALGWLEDPSSFWGCGHADAFFNRARKIMEGKY